MKILFPIIAGSLIMMIISYIQLSKETSELQRTNHSLVTYNDSLSNAVRLLQENQHLSDSIGGYWKQIAGMYEKGYKMWKGAMIDAEKQIKKLSSSQWDGIQLDTKAYNERHK